MADKTSMMKLYPSKQLVADLNYAKQSLGGDYGHSVDDSTGVGGNACGSADNGTGSGEGWNPSGDGTGSGGDGRGRPDGGTSSGDGTAAEWW